MKLDTLDLSAIPDGDLDRIAKEILEMHDLGLTPAHGKFRDLIMTVKGLGMGYSHALDLAEKMATREFIRRTLRKR